MRIGIPSFLAVALLWSGSGNVWSADEAVAPAASVPVETLPDPTQAPAPTTPDGPLEPDPSKIVFAVTEYRVEGNAILPSDQVNAILAQYRGSMQRVSDVEQARGALESAYREAGYPTVLVVVPEQTVEDGVVKLTVIESKLGELTVTGNRHISTRRLLDKLPSLRPGVILHEPTVLEELDGVNATLDRQVVPVLTVGQDPGTVNLELKVRDRVPLHGNVEWNNRGTPSTPEQRLSVSVRYADVFAREHILALQTTQSPQDWGAVEVYGASYVIPLEGRRSLSTYVATSNSRSALDGSSLSTAGGDVAITGNATVAGVRYAFEIKELHQLSVGLDYKRLGESEALFPGDLGTAVVSTPVSYAPVSLAYSGSARDDDGVTRWSLSIKEHIADLVPGGGKREFGGDPEDPLAVPGNRAGATGTFFVIQAGGGRVQQLEDGFSLSLAVDGQVASEPLIAAEQFLAGGIESVRGYIENEAQGDHGIRGAVELTTPRRLFRGPERWFSGSLQAALFADGAALSVKDAPPGQTNHYTLVGLGFGVRVMLMEGIEARLDQAWALADGTVTRRGDARGHVSLKFLF